MFKTIQGWWRREEGTQQLPELTLAVTKLMVGMMAMDGMLDDDEHGTIVTMLSDQFGLPAEEATALIAQASSDRDDLRIDKVVTQVIASYTVEERAAILAKLWRVALADGNVDFLEEQYINRLAGLIKVPGSALAELKAKEEKMFPDLNHSGRYQNPPVV